MAPFSPASAGRVWRYYQVGVVNTLFGYGVYALLVSAGLQMFAAQLVGHIIGVIFNYFTYSRHVFQDAPASKLRFVLSYGCNYVVGLASLAFAATLLSSPYLAGLLAVLIASVVNFIVLRRFVFPSGAPDARASRPTAGDRIDHAPCG